MSTKKVSLIAAMGQDRAIGKDNALLWKIKEDMRLFRSVTGGKTVVMGRRTAESIGMRLPGRTNIVITSGEAPYEDQLAMRSLSEAILAAQGEVVIIGGAQLYAEALSIVDTMYLTLVHGTFPEADTFFPPFDLRCFDVLLQLRYPPAIEPPYSFDYFHLTRAVDSAQPSWMAAAEPDYAEAVNRLFRTGIRGSAIEQKIFDEDMDKEFEAFMASVNNDG